MRGGRHATGTVAIKKSHLIIAAAVLVVALGAGAYLLVSHLNKPPDEAKPPGGQGLILDYNAKDYTGSDPEDRGGESAGTKIPGYSTVRLPSGKTDVKMVLLNPEGNQCYFVFELVADGETYYTSNLVAPSKCIEDLTLTKPLKKGTYKATLKISCYSLDESHTQMNGAHVEFELIAY